MEKKIYFCFAVREQLPTEVHPWAVNCFTAVEDPDRVREFAIERSCQKTAAKQMLHVACFNSLAAKLLQEVKKMGKAV